MPVKEVAAETLPPAVSLSPTDRADMTKGTHGEPKADSLVSYCVSPTVF